MNKKKKKSVYSTYDADFLRQLDEELLQEEAAHTEYLD